MRRRQTVFNLDSTGAESVLHSFSGYPSDGYNVYVCVVMDSAGDLYGTLRGLFTHSVRIMAIFLMLLTAAHRK